MLGSRADADDMVQEERAAFLLHDVFDSDYDEVAAALGKSDSVLNPDKLRGVPLANRH